MNEPNVIQHLTNGGHPSVIPSGAISLTHLAPTAIEKRLADLQQQIDDLTARINSMAAECQP